jgi:hypothetical protein
VGQFRLLCPHFINNRYFEGGEVVDTTTGMIPSDWFPTTACEPLDDAAAAAFYAAGPRGQSIQFGYAGGPGHFVGQAGGPPKIYWAKIPGPQVHFVLVGTNFPPQ